MERRGIARRLGAVLLGLAVIASGPAGASTQNDAGSGADAGNSFETATLVTPKGPYSGRLDRAAGDRHDVYRFALAQRESLSVLVTTSTSSVDPITILDPNGVPVDVATRTSGLGAAASDAFTHELGAMRLAIHQAPIAGEYRLHLRAEQFNLGTYTLCFMNCETPRTAPNDFIFGGSLRQTHTSVLLVPPMHGDLGDPLGPTVLDYINATLRGIHTWEKVLDAFAADYPEFAYLRKIDVDVEIFDRAAPVDPAGYDVVIGYVAAGPVFRGVATSTVDLNQFFRTLGLGSAARFSGRGIALSLFGASPRAGQVMWDFPEVTDLEIVTVHEFAHTFGLGHTLWWDATLGPDLMNSPATFIYGNGSPVGDAGVHTPLHCLSSLNLYGMARLYRWIPSGTWQGTFGSVSLPGTIPYKLYCPSW